LWEEGSAGKRQILPAGTAPFHGSGWLEGYVEISRQTLRQAAGLPSEAVPTLQESLAAMDAILNATMEE
jgi:hypothetical protein